MLVPLLCARVTILPTQIPIYSQRCYVMESTVLFALFLGAATDIVLQNYNSFITIEKRAIYEKKKEKKTQCLTMFNNTQTLCMYSLSKCLKITYKSKKLHSNIYVTPVRNFKQNLKNDILSKYCQSLLYTVFSCSFLKQPPPLSIRLVIIVMKVNDGRNSSCILQY